MNLKCDLDIKFAQPGHRFCTLANREKHLSKVELKSLMDQEIWSGHQLKGKAHDLEV